MSKSEKKQQAVSNNKRILDQTGPRPQQLDYNLSAVKGNIVNVYDSGKPFRFWFISSLCSTEF